MYMAVPEGNESPHLLRRHRADGRYQSFTKFCLGPEFRCVNPTWVLVLVNTWVDTIREQGLLRLPKKLESQITDGQKCFANNDWGNNRAELGDLIGAYVND